MPPPFRVLTVDQFAREVGAFAWKRNITDVHWHHTASPRHADFFAKGAEQIQADMHRTHTKPKEQKGRGWSDIGQHVSILPDGTVVTGRDWNKPPASAKGHNGTYGSGPFMFEMVGNFVDGEDPFKDPQREAAVQVTAIIQERFGLAVANMRFHKQMSATQCPGDISYDRLLKSVASARNLPGYSVEGGHEEWHGGSRRTDIRESGTIKDANRGKLVTIASTAGGVASASAGIFKIVPPIYAGIALILILFMAGAGLWWYLSSIKRRRREDHARGRR